jgi:protein SCO1/2
MTKPTAWIVSAILISGVHTWAAERHSARGIVLEVNATHRSLVISCEAIPGYMDPMEMPFVVHNSSALLTLKPGATVRFAIAEHGKKLYAEDIRDGTAMNFESEPMEAGGLTMLHTALNPSAAGQAVKVGQQVPDFVLKDQARKEIHLSQLEGKVVALTFGYSRCPNPNYCFRLSDNLARLGRRFHDRAGRDLVLITIVIDPEHDQGTALTQYANAWNADPEVWHFLTGQMSEIKQVSEMFGMDFWSEEGLLTHSLHTVIIDRDGKLAANLDGNQFTAKELGDLVQAVMNRPR